MKVVKPITNYNKINDIEVYLKDRNERDYILFLMLLHTGLRLGDVLKLRIEDVYRKDNIFIKEQKTGKRKEIQISTKLKRELNSYCKNRSSSEYLIKSRNGYNKPIGRVRAYEIIKKVGNVFELNNFACHSLRKTFGRRYFEKYKNIEELRDFFNHSNSTVTLRYIGLEQDIINKHVKDLWS